MSPLRQGPPRPADRPVRSGGWLLAGCALLLSGCTLPWDRPEPVPRHILSYHTTPQLVHLHRIAMLPFYTAEGVGRSATVFNDAMVASLRELGLQQVITVPIETRDTLLPTDVIAANGMSSADLLHLRDALHVDGILVGRIDDFDGFDPISMSVTAIMLSCLDGQVVWSAEGHFDSRRQDIQDEVERWYKRTAGTGSDGISGWKIVLESPRLFSRYVAERLTLSMPMPRSGAHPAP
jgi:hypothetical protein